MKNQPVNLLSAEFWRDIAQDAVRSASHVVAILIAYLVLRALLYRVIDSVLARLTARESRLGMTEERRGRLQTLRGLCKSVVAYVLFFVFGVLFLKALGFDIMPFITTAGVIGLAIGFGAQKLVKDVISGFFIIIDNIFVVGDTVTIGTTTGTVCELGMRVTRIQDAGGREYIISNGDIATVTNLSRHPVVDFIEVAVAPAADLNKAVEIINATGKNLLALPDDNLRAAPHVLGITAFNATSVTIRVSVVSEPTNLLAEQMRVRGAVREALIAAEIPIA